MKRSLLEMINEELDSMIERARLKKRNKPPQETDRILPDRNARSKVYGAASKSYDMTADGEISKPLKLSDHDVYKDAREATLSEGLSYHLKNNLPLSESVYRPGTREFFDLFNEARELWLSGGYAATNEEYELFQSDLGRWAKYEGRMVPLDFPMFDEALSEAKYKGREVKLGAAGASRSGGRAHVYVRDPKSGNVRKVSFGSSMPDAMGNSPKAKARRKSFGERHGCSDKKDKTKAGYWACRSTKLFGRSIPGWW